LCSLVAVVSNHQHDEYAVVYEGAQSSTGSNFQGGQTNRLYERGLVGSVVPPRVKGAVKGVIDQIPNPLGLRRLRPLRRLRYLYVYRHPRRQHRVASISRKFKKKRTFFPRTYY
jgi:hypothetical protein